MPRSRSSTWAATASVLLLTPWLLTGCQGVRARSENSFDEIRHLVAEMEADEVVRLLGEPDSRQPIFGDDEKWIWWNYTFLDGNNYPPEIRGQVVHLEILVKNPAGRVDGRLAVNYRMPATKSGA